MRTVNTFFSLAPAPMFLLGAILSYALTHHSMCGGFTLEMPTMWLVMAIAHVSPWLMWWQQRRFQRFQTRPDKQQ
jgi:uncharacterized membrane protein YesL